ncbi:hypothetical protein YTCETSXE_CDS0005 [Staphylococcus phage MVC_VPHSA2]|uniref:Major tail protein n=1 Tax=Staphylococcus phage MVC_VPHSA1 TaxID=3088876 RepID=A0ABZ0QZE8_9CAUD|nr:hypothetical protein FBHYGVHD_CDS0027 [Staphylococcus phage MVC_VPHSA1]WPF64961.1 hypothetical protein YTCETSXE_CDS0005 [Staphylococcus phage MVC_VPHSA2]
MPKQAQGYDHTVSIGVETTAGVKATVFKHATIIESFEPEEKTMSMFAEVLDSVKLSCCVQVRKRLTLH